MLSALTRDRELGLSFASLKPQNWIITVVFAVVMMAWVTWDSLTDYREEVQEEQRVLAQRAHTYQQLVADLLDDKFDLLADTLRLMAQDERLLSYALSRSEADKQQLEMLWDYHAEQTEQYTQLRFLDVAGQEKIRVNYIPGLDEANAVKNLQYKGARGYFKQAQLMEDGELGFALFDLEYEGGKPVRPYKLGGRVVAPVSHNGERLGYFVANLNMAEVLRVLSLKTEYHGFELDLLDSNGNFIFNHLSFNQLGHVLPLGSEESLLQEDQQMWSYITSWPRGDYQREEGTYSFHWLDFNSEELSYLVGDGRYILLTHISEELSQGLSRKAKKELIIAWTAKSVIALVFTLLLMWGLLRYQARASSETLLKAALNGMSAVLVTDSRQNILGVNSALVRLTGFSEAELVGHPVSKLASGIHNGEFYHRMWESLERSQHWSGDVTNRNKDGRLIHLRVEINAIRSERLQKKPDFYVANYLDISGHREREEQLVLAATTDPLTGIANRRLFETELKRSVRLGRRYANSSFSLILIDLDHFKAVNDTYGHSVGDQVLVRTAAAINKLIRDTDTLARIGGEEFALLLPQTSQAEASFVAERICQQLRLIEEKPFVTASIGLTHYQGERKAVEVLDKADQALYKAKREGRDQVVRYREELYAELQQSSATA